MVDENPPEVPVDLAPQHLEEYAQLVREKFAIEELEEIAFAAITALPTEIERRRALLRYFIPDIFQPGRYDRRADLIDACIYYLDERNRKTVLRLWARRAGFNWRDIFARDIEHCPYGYVEYHPIYHTIGKPPTPSPYLPQLVRHLRVFRNRRLRLDINDYTTIYFSVFKSDSPIPLFKGILLQVLHRIDHALTAPNWEGLNLRQFMTDQGFKENSHILSLLRQNTRLLPLLERSVFGLGHLILQFPFPYHYRVYYKQSVMTQHFLTGGNEHIQEITFSFPIEADWHELVRSLHPETRVIRQTFLRHPHTPHLELFDEASQRWQVPWEHVIANCRDCVLENAANTAPLEVGFNAFIPTPMELRLAATLEQDALFTNAELAAQLKLPLEEVQRIRQFVEEELVVQRELIVKYGDFTDLCFLDLSGIDVGKFNILTKIGAAFPSFSLMQLEDLKTGEKWLRGVYIHEPHQIRRLLAVLEEVFGDTLAYNAYTSIQKSRLLRTFYNYYRFDSASGSWQREGEFRFQPIWRKGA